MEKSLTIQIIEAAFQLVLLPVILWGLKELAELLKSRTKNAKVQKYISIAEEAVCNAVKTVSQTYVDALKESEKFDEEAQKEAFRQAMELTRAQLTEDAVATLKEAFGDVEVFLRAKIEANVLDGKKR